MDVIKIDAELLRKSALAAAHVAEQTRAHIESEYDRHVPTIMETLKADGPYGYMIFPQVLPDGAVKLPILTTWDEVRQGYEAAWQVSHMLALESVMELRGAWYAFHEALSTVRLVDSGEVVKTQIAVLMTASNPDAKGITGEICWARAPRARLGSGADDAEADVSTNADEMMRRLQLTELHDRYLESLRAADLTGLLSVMNDGVQSSARNYVDDTGALIGLESIEALGVYYQSFFDKYELLSVDLLQRVAQEWYLFAETRFTVRPRAGAGGPLAFHTAEIFAPAKDGRFIAHLGHGADPA
jgi:hypothetical protein